MITLDDLDAAPWASCGPVALAALLGRQIADIRHAFPAQREGRTWTNAAQMHRALDALGVAWRVTELDWGSQCSRERAWPRRGLALIQFNGSWSDMPVDHPAQLQRTHWIAFVAKGQPLREQWTTADAVFDVNAVGTQGLSAQGWWQSLEHWEMFMAPELAVGYGRKADGTWWVREGIEVSR